MIITLTAIALALLLVNLCLELKRDLMMFQQNSYMLGRYRAWIGESGDTTSVWRLGGLVIFFISLSTLSHPYGALALAGLFGGVCAWTLFSASYKKPLVWTARARRLYAVALLVTAGICVAAVALFDHSSAFEVLYTLSITLLGCYCGSHLIMALAYIVLQPVEKANNRRYYNDAARILRAMPDLRIVGITGSYGKTSTKHFLYRILSEQYDTLMTPGNFNTTLGVIRTVREHLKPYNEVFICEMGAKNIGDIKEICDLVHPGYGIITAVGPQHLESFRTIENVQATKFELADALPAEGVVVLNQDFPKIADRPVANCRCLRYGVGDSGADYRAEDVRYTPEGTTFAIVGPDGWKLCVKTRLMGECNVSDLLAAAVMARQLGIPDAKIVTAIAAIEPVEHRLSVKNAGGITILDDAYNSNPVGSRMALEVLGTFKGGKRICVTPGMVELGPEQYELNFELGKHVAANADVAIIVNKVNRDALVSGIKDTGTFPQADLHVVDSFAEAQRVLAGLASSGDTVLYENDLPDTLK